MLRLVSLALGFQINPPIDYRTTSDSNSKYFSFKKFMYRKFQIILNHIFVWVEII